MTAALVVDGVSQQRFLDGIRMGGCIRCERTVRIHLHHEDPATKSFDFGVRARRPWPVLLAEVEKCVPLCGRCHGKAHRLRERKRQVETRLPADLYERLKAVSFATDRSLAFIARRAIRELVEREETTA